MPKTNANLRGRVETALVRAANNPSLSIQSADVRRIADDIDREMDEILAGKPWWRSRTIWGALLAAIAQTAQLTGFPIADAAVAEILDLIMQWVTIGGVALAIWGRLKAQKPIGTLPAK